MKRDDVAQHRLREALEDHLSTLSLADLLRPYYARETNGWLRCTWDGEDWEISGPWQAPGNAYTSAPGEWWLDVGIDTDDNAVAAIDEMVREQMGTEGWSEEDDDFAEEFQRRTKAAYAETSALDVVDVEAVVSRFVNHAVGPDGHLIRPDETEGSGCYRR